MGGHKTKSENCESINKCNFSSNRIIVKGIYIALILMWTQISALSAVGGGGGEGGTTSRPDSRSPVDLDLAWKTFGSSARDPFRSEYLGFSARLFSMPDCPDRR